MSKLSLVVYVRMSENAAKTAHQVETLLCYNVA